MVHNCFLTLTKTSSFFTQFFYGPKYLFFTDTIYHHLNTHFNSFGKFCCQYQESYRFHPIMNHPVCSLFGELFEFSLFSSRFSATSKEGKSNAAFILYLWEQQQVLCRFQSTTERFCTRATHSVSNNRRQNNKAQISSTRIKLRATKKLIN